MYNLYRKRCTFSIFFVFHNLFNLFSVSFPPRIVFHICLDFFLFSINAFEGSAVFPCQFISDEWQLLNINTIIKIAIINTAYELKEIIAFLFNQQVPLSHLFKNKMSL